MMKKYLFILLIAQQALAKEIVILVHGTWALSSAWCQPGGDFYDTLEEAAHALGKILIPFSWSGKLDHNVRVTAARNLAKIIQSYPATTPISLVCHSHGTNVALLAADIIAKSKQPRTIEKLYALATPVNTALYKPNMAVINHLYNFFSLEDYIQTVFGFFERVFPVHERLANLRISLHNDEPGHMEIHDPAIARWILSIHQELEKTPVGGFNRFKFGKPGFVQFFNYRVPQYYEDTRQEELVHQDLLRQRKKFITQLRQQLLLPLHQDELL